MKKQQQIKTTIISKTNRPIELFSVLSLFLGEKELANLWGKAYLGTKAKKAKKYGLTMR